MCRISLWLAVASYAVFWPVPVGAESPVPYGAVATVREEATDVAIETLRDGGNAVDAAVAAALMLGVVDGHNSGIGGGCFVLIRSPDGRLTAIDGREKAPQRARRDMYVRQGKAVPQLSQTGALASGVPGALAAYDEAVRRFGSKPLSDLLLPAARVAEEGFRVDGPYAAALRRTRSVLAQFPASRQMLLRPDGQPYHEGDVLRLPDLAATYRAIADQGIGWFYKGPFAERVDQWMARNGGLLSREDFAAYQAVVREPVISSYRGYRVVGFPPPSSGGIHVAQILNILEHFDLAALYERDEATAVHLIIEAMKRAFADRAYWLGDADFAEVPRGLIDPSYAAPLAEQIDLERATAVSQHGTPPRWQTDVFGRHTTHIAAADRQGYWVAITATVNTTFGSKVVIPETGVVLNNEMDDFSSQPGVPNAFGLIGAEANAIEPGKRPLSSMSPTIVLKDGQPVLTVGAAGGPKIITQVVLAIVRRLDRHASLEEAIAAPRFHHQWFPDEVLLETSAPESLAKALVQRGHTIRRSGTVGITQAISVDPQGRLMAVHDPRIPGKAAVASGLDGGNK